MVEVDFKLVIEIKTMEVLAVGEERIEEAEDIVNGFGVVYREGQESGLHNFSIDCTVTLDIYILTTIINFSCEWWESCILDNFVNLYCLIQGTIKLSCQGAT